MSGAREEMRSVHLSGGEERRVCLQCRAVASLFGPFTSRVQTHFKAVCCRRIHLEQTRFKRRKTPCGIPVALQSGGANHLTRLCAAPTCMVQVNPKTSATQPPQFSGLLITLSNNNVSIGTNEKDRSDGGHRTPDQPSIPEDVV